jgi:GDP-L-fucose synthase
MTFWSDRRVLLTGSGGFLGRVITSRIERSMPAAFFTPRKSELDLRDGAAVRAYLRENRPNLVIHAAAVVGGIGANRAHPGRFFYENAIMGIQLIEEARRAGVEKFVCLGTICAYPKFTPIPFHEDDLWNGYPEETNAPYGIAKKANLVHAQVNAAQHGQRFAYLIPTNLYGPGDKFHPSVSHVIPALIKKCVEAVEAGQDKVEVWGTGRASREYLYVDDAAEGIVLAAEHADGIEPINLGADHEITILETAERIAALVGFEGALVWDPTQPDGQPRRRVDASRAEQLLGWRARMPFEEGLRRTIDWYRTHRVEADRRPT